MNELPMAGLPGESKLRRAQRLARAAKLLRTVAEDAVAENERAYQRALDAIQRAETAEHEADMAYAAWERSLAGDGHD
jgi:hypothetical protein